MMPKIPPGPMKITALAAGFIMASLDTTVMQVAGVTIQESLDASLSQLTWAVDGYVLTFAALLMLAGGLANRVGARRVYMWGMATFGVASLASALATGIEVLIAARLLQGAGAALFMPSSLALLVRAFPDARERTKVLGVWSAIVSSSMALGPTVGGIMVGVFGWPSIFLINLPIGIAGMLLTRRHIAGGGGDARPLAAPGHAAVIVLLAGVSLMLIEGPQRGWSAAPVLAAIAATVLATVLLIGRERRTDNQVMPWTLFRGARFAGANAVGFLFNAAFYGSLFMIGLYVQHGRGASPFQAGLQILPLTIFIPFANIAFARISGRVATGLLLAVSFLVAGTASLALTALSAATPYWMLAVALGLTSIASGFIAPAMTAAMVNAAGTRHANTAGSVLNANRQIGSLVGIAAIGAILAVTSGWTTGAALSSLLVGAAYIASALIAWRLIHLPERREATATTAATVAGLAPEAQPRHAGKTSRPGSPS
ncbi:MFS transporter [Nonomuraea jiangxiensis]|uniref:MFS transporter, DHA2 family, methylenomycin A resistance protein n=1 Tax=Nonomuraea jiangxiensis TaxID=633440 RepID=A0A1G9VEW0_9ACTN|nr:MFS transporter [Nonomuraea jiangxiensis]SDM70734.1 MFS transporter, DHA2 family, methylenomycin A resistance protein [Nonomuraea jiangxiensis]